MDHHLRVMSNCVLANAILCSSEHRIFCGPSLCLNSHVCHSIELQPLKNLFRLLDCLDDCCLVLSHNRNVLVPLQCAGPVGAPLVILPHICITGIFRLTHWNCGEPDAAPSWEHWQSHQSSRSVTTFKSSCASDSHVLAFHHNGHPHDLIHEQSLWYLNDLLDLLDGGHCPCTTWMISVGFGIFLMFGISLCVTRETVDAVACTTGVFTTLSHCQN